ncbi:MAG: hypothetical protein MZW92_31160 [Comamonadaceae bacterium]|nr:hypothetical protein [Comamonadaceae bacterium]
MTPKAFTGGESQCDIVRSSALFTVDRPIGLCSQGQQGGGGWDAAPFARFQALSRALLKTFPDLPETFAPEENVDGRSVPDIAEALIVIKVAAAETDISVGIYDHLAEGQDTSRIVAERLIHDAGPDGPSAVVEHRRFVIPVDGQ